MWDDNNSEDIIMVYGQGKERYHRVGVGDLGIVRSQ